MWLRAAGIRHMAQQNFYETLGLQKGASAKEIKSAYYQVLDFLVRYCLYKDISTVSQTPKGYFGSFGPLGLSFCDNGSEGITFSV
jgi:hypothetical protein